MGLRYLAPLAMAVGSVHRHWQLERVPAARSRWYRHLAAGGFPPAVPVSPISGGPLALRERLTTVASYEQRRSTPQGG